MKSRRNTEIIRRQLNQTEISQSKCDAKSQIIVDAKPDCFICEIIKLHILVIAVILRNELSLCCPWLTYSPIMHILMDV